MQGSYEAVGESERVKRNGSTTTTQRRGYLVGGVLVALGILAVVILVPALPPKGIGVMRHITETPAQRDARLKGGSAWWVPFEAKTHPDKPTSIWGAVRRPYPTGAWWTNLVVGGPVSAGDGLGPAMMTPYAVTVTPAKGVALSYGALSVTNESLTISASTDLGIRLKDGISKRYVLSYDDLTMTMRLEGEGTMDALFARGSPYATFIVRHGKPELHSDFEIAQMVAVDPLPSTDDDDDDSSSSSKKNRTKLFRECALYPSCVAAGMKGECCPMDKSKGYIRHPCCDGPLGKQGPATIFSFQTKNGYEWRVYTATPTTWTWSPKAATTVHEYDDVLRVALVPDASGLDGSPSFDASDKGETAMLEKANAIETDALILDDHAGTYPTGGDVRVTADRSADVDAGHIVFEWRVAYMPLGAPLHGIPPLGRAPSLLMLALPHHVDTLLISPALGFLPEGSLKYRGGLKGQMTPVLGASWTMREVLPDMDWTPPRHVPEKYKPTILEQLNLDVQRPKGEEDTMASWIAYNDYFGNAYWNGKEMARLATLELIAEHVTGSTENEAVVSARNQLRSILDLWLDHENADPLVYDATYGGLCTINGLYDHNADFGMGYYNDHHFHLGYFLYAAAVAAKLDAGFVPKYRDQLFALFYDIANPGVGSSLFEAGIDRTAFPRARHKDFYDGHSWASGIFFMGQGKAQESSSEAINAYYGAYLLALAMGDVELVDWSRILLAMEIRTAQTYYHMPVHSPIYPKDFAHNKMVGVLGALSTGTVTWFGPSPLFSHGIQILPVTPITELVFQNIEFVREDIRFMDHLLATSDLEDADPWLCFIECERSIIDKDRAWQNLRALQRTDQGTTKTALLYFIATRPEPNDRKPL